MLVAAALVAGAGCRDGDGDRADRRPGEASGTVLEREPEPSVVDVVRAEVVSSAAARGRLDPGIADQVARVLARYLDLAVIAPMRTGSTAPGIHGLMTPDAAARAGDIDRAAMVDEGLPRSAEVRRAKAAVGLTGLASEVGVELVVARIDWDLHGRDRQGEPVARVIRTGELTLIPFQDQWTIAAYDMRVSRHVGSATTRARAATSTSTSTTSTTTGEKGETTG